MSFHERMDKSSPLTAGAAPLAILPPQPAQSAGGPAAANQDFREMLATQGIKAPAGAVPTAAEAQIEAAQIAAKANVNMGVKRQPVLTGMQQPQPATVIAPNPGRFLPLRQGPSAARVYTGPVGTPTASVESLRATAKFAPGPVVNTVKTVPALARTTNTDVEETPAQTTPPSAVEAYTYGLRAASENKMGTNAPSQVPPWFDGAVQNALDKYAALNKVEKKP